MKTNDIIIGLDGLPHKVEHINGRHVKVITLGKNIKVIEEIDQDTTYTEKNITVKYEVQGGM